MLETNFFSVDLQMGKCGCQKLSIKFFLYSTTQNVKFFKMFLQVKMFLPLTNQKSQIPGVNHVAYNLVEMGFLSNSLETEHNIIFFLHMHAISMKPSRSNAQSYKRVAVLIA